MNKKKIGCALVLSVALGMLAAADAGAAGCVNGAYRAGCAGPNGAVGVRKTPYRAPVYRPPVYRPPVYHAAPVYRPNTVVVAPRPPVVVVPPPRPPVVVVPAY